MPISKKEVFGSGPGKGKGIQFPSDPAVFEEAKMEAIPMSGPENIDEQVIPAARNKGIPEDGGIIGGGDNRPTEVEDLKGEDVKLAAPLIPVFGEETVKKLFSKNWVNRENGLIEIEEIVNSNPDSDCITAALGAAARGIGDKIGQVVLKTFDIISSVLGIYQEPAPGDATFYIDEIISQLINRIGDNNGRIRDRSLEIGIELAAHPIAGHSLVIDHITRPPGKKSSSQSVRQQAGRYKLLHEILVNSPITKPAEQRTWVNYCVTGFKNSNKEIRDNAYDCIIEVYRVMGSSIEKFLEDLRPAQLELLKKGFNDVDGIDPGMDKGEKKPKVTIETNISPYGGGKAKGGKEKPIGPKSGELDMLGESPSKFESSFKADNDNVCQFWGKYEIGWDQEALDMHYWKDWLMLTPWTGWGQVLEISGLNNHLLEEWENGGDYSQCPRWKEPIPNEEFDAHTEEGLWNIAKSQKDANRCPLCHEDIYPAGEDGWKQHILIDICPNNMH